MTLGQIRLDRREMMERTKKLAAIQVELLHLVAIYPKSQNPHLADALWEASGGISDALAEARAEQERYQEEWRRG